MEQLTLITNIKVDMYKSGYGAFVKKDIRATRGGHEIEMWLTQGLYFGLEKLE